MLFCAVLHCRLFRLYSVLCSLLWVVPVSMSAFVCRVIVLILLAFVSLSDVAGACPRAAPYCLLVYNQGSGV